MLQKQKDRKKLDDMEDFMKSLNRKIKRVANEGGREEINTEISGNLKVRDVDPPAMDNITLTFETKGQLVATNNTIELVGESGSTAPMTQEPGVITVYSERISGNEYKIRMNLYYKTLTSAGSKNYRIDLNNLGRNTVGNREITVVIEGGKTEQISGGLTVNHVNIRLV